MCAGAAFRRIVSKSCVEIRILNCLSFFMFPLFLLKWVWAAAANSIWRGAGTPATSQMRCWLLRRHKLHIPRPAASGRSRPFRCASSQNRNRVAGLRFCVFCARRRNVGFSCRAAHALAVGAESRTQRRHAPHGTVQVLGTPAGSIVPIVFTGRKSARSARLREIHRLPLLR